MPEYAVTLKKTRSPILDSDYFNYLDYLNEMFSLSNVNFESTKGLHCHFILESAQALNYQDLYIHKYGWSIKAIPIYNRERWIKYCKKDLKDNKQINKKYKKHIASEKEEKVMIEAMLSEAPYPFNQETEADNDTPIEDEFTFKGSLFI